MEDITADERLATPSKIKIKKEKVSEGGKKRGFFRYLFDLFANWVLIASLLAIDFALFAGAGGNNLFADAFNLSPQSTYILTGIGIVSFGLIFVVSFSRLLQNVVTSAVVGLFAVIMFSHFTLFDETTFLNVLTQGITSIASHIILGAVLAIVCFVFLSFSSRMSIFYLAATVVVLFGWIMFESHMQAATPQKEFETVFEKKSETAVEKNKKFVYIAMPNLASYRYVKDMKDGGINPDKISKTADIILAFYAKNNFSLYPNAYISESKPFENLVSSLNFSPSEKSADFLMNSISVDGYWKFDKLNDKFYYLKESKLYNTFSKAKYELSAYETREVDLCHLNDKMAVSKCINKNNLPSDVQNLKLSNDKKARILFFQWLETMNLVNNNQTAHSLLKTFFGGDGTPLAGTKYRNLYTIDAPKMLDILAEDVINDKDNRAYFAFVDLPSNTYIYNEYCQIKPIDSWLATDPSKSSVGQNMAAKKSAYLDHVACLYGKLEEFITKLKQSGNFDNTVIVLQGLNSFESPDDANFITNFQNKNLVNMAIRDPMKQEFRANMGICKPEEILAYYLYQKGECSNLSNVGLQEESKKELIKHLSSLKIGKQDAIKALGVFNEWYNGWLKLNNPKELEIKLEQQEAVKNAQPDWVEGAENLDVSEDSIAKETPKTEAPIIEAPVEAPAPAPAAIVEAVTVTETVVETSAETTPESIEAPAAITPAREEPMVFEEQNTQSFAEYELSNPEEVSQPEPVAVEEGAPQPLVDIQQLEQQDEIDAELKGILDQVFEGDTKVVPIANDDNLQIDNGEE